MKNLIRTMTIILLTAILINEAQADVFTKEKEHSDPVAFMGQNQPAKDKIKTTWITTDKVRSDDAEISVIMRLDKGLLYILQHKQKVYMEVPLNFTASAAKEPASDMGIKITVTPTNETKKINLWNCKKYIMKMEMGGMGFATESEIWTTEEIKIDPVLYTKFTGALMAANPILASSLYNMVEELKKMKGVHVLNITSVQMMGQTIKTSTELIEFKEGKAPQGIFELPAGYSKQSMMGGMN